MCWCDISILYSLIPTEFGIEAIRYWLNKKQGLIPQWFTNDFIIDSLKFVLKKKQYFIWWPHVPSMGTKCAPPYACLTVGFFEEAKLFTNELPKYFNGSKCKSIMELLKRYMDDGFIF